MREYIDRTSETLENIEKTEWQSLKLNRREKVSETPYRKWKNWESRTLEFVHENRERVNGTKHHLDEEREQVGFSWVKMKWERE